MLATPYGLGQRSLRDRFQCPEFNVNVPQRLQIAHDEQVGLDPGTSDFSLSFRVIPPSSGTNRTWVCKGAASDTVNDAPGYFVFQDSNNRLAVRVTDSAHSTRLAYTATTTTLTIGSWNDIAVNFDRDGNIQGFVNGIAQNTLDMSAHAGSITTTREFVIGMRVPINDLLFDGCLTRLVLRTRLLTADEITQMITHPRSWARLPNTDQVVSWWEFDGSFKDNYGPNHLKDIGGVRLGVMFRQAH